MICFLSSIMNECFKISFTQKPSPKLWGLWRGGLFSLLFIAFSSIAFTQDITSDEAMETIHRWEKMWNSYDLSEVEHLFVTSENISYFSSEKIGIVQGIQAVVDHHVGFGFVKGGKSTEARLWLENISIEPIDQVAIVTGLWYFQRTPETEKQHGPVTFVLVGQQGKMKIQHVHFANY